MLNLIPNIHSLERVETHFPSKRKKRNTLYTHHTYYVFAMAKLCPITFPPNPEQDTCHPKIPPIHLAQK